MLSENQNIEQTNTAAPDSNEELNSHLEGMCHELSETAPMFLIIGDTSIKYDLLVKQDMPNGRLYDLDAIRTAINEAEKSKNDIWKTFLKKRKNGLLVILYSNINGDDSNQKKATKMYEIMVKQGLTSVYLWDCNFGIPKFSKETTKAELEKGLKEAYSKIHSASVSLGEFEARFDMTRNEPPVSTGYARLDELLDGGLYPGMYVFGADTSLGKSTFWLNIATNISNKGRSVLYFSIEMSNYQMTGRMLSRETYLLKQGLKGKAHAQTGRTLTTYTKFDALSPEDKELVTKAKIIFKHKARNLYLFENIGEIYPETIRNEIMNFLTTTGTSQPPVIIIDYLQILRSKDKYIDSNDKLKLDKNLFFFKKLSNEYRLPIICISSLNRDSYKEYKRITMTSFKDSGNVEYTADVLLGMQLERLAHDGTLSAEQAEEELSNEIRDIDLIVLKNRDGQRSTHTHFKYHTWFNDFQEVVGFDRYPNKKDVTNGYTGRTIKTSVNDEDEDDLLS